jgi:hypothetical protein
MSKDEAQQAATRYLRDQAEIMKKYGSAPKLSGKRYEESKTATTRAFQSLSSTR